MKKKKIICITIIAFLLVVFSIGSSVFYKNYKKEQKIKQEKLIAQKLVKKTNEKYAFYLENKIIENPQDETSKLFNQVLEEEKKNEEINSEEIKSFINLENIETSLNSINEEIANYDITLLNNFSKKQVINSLSKDVDKNTVLKIYNQNKFIKKLKEEKEKRKNYLDKLLILKDELSDINAVKNLFYINKDNLVAKNNEVLAKLQNLNTKYTLNLKIELEQPKPITQNSSVKELAGVPILCYHGVLDEPWGIESLFVKTSEFDAQMKYLKENGYTTLFASEISKANNYEKPVIITFDDGYKDVYTNAFPILKKYNLKANIYIISAWLNGDVYMSTADLQEMASSSLIEVGSHTVNHKALAKLSESDIEYELKTSQEDLKKITGQNITGIAYPTGSFDSRVTNIASKYYNYGLSTINGKENPQKLNTYTLRRIYVYRKYNINNFMNLF